MVADVRRRDIMSHLFLLLLLLSLDARRVLCSSGEMRRMNVSHCVSDDDDDDVSSSVISRSPATTN